MCSMCCEPLLSATNRTKTNKQKLMCREGGSKGTGPTPCPPWHVIGRLGVCISIGRSLVAYLSRVFATSAVVRRRAMRVKNPSPSCASHLLQGMLGSCWIHLWKQWR